MRKAVMQGAVAIGITDDGDKFRGGLTWTMAEQPASRWACRAKKRTSRPARPRTLNSRPRMTAICACCVLNEGAMKIQISRANATEIERALRTANNGAASHAICGFAEIHDLAMVSADAGKRKRPPGGGFCFARFARLPQKFALRFDDHDSGNPANGVEFALQLFGLGDCLAFSGHECVIVRNLTRRLSDELDKNLWRQVHNAPLKLKTPAARQGQRYRRKRCMPSPT